MEVQKEYAPAGYSERPSSKAAGESKPEAYPSGAHGATNKEHVRAAESVRRPGLR